MDSLCTLGYYCCLFNLFLKLISLPKKIKQEEEEELKETEIDRELLAITHK